MTQQQLALTFEAVPIDQLHPSEDNPRRDIGDVTELAASMKSVGVLEPLLVTADGNGGYEIVAGARRFAGAKKAGLTEVPVRIVELDAAGRAEVMLIENLQRADLAPIEEAHAYQRLIDLGSYSQRSLAERIGRSQAHISKRLTLLELPPPALKALDSGGITIEDAVHLTKLKDHPEALATVLEEKKEEDRYAYSDDVDVKLLVQDRLDAMTEQAKFEAAEQKLVKAHEDVPYVPMVKDRYNNWDLPKGAKYLQRGYYNSVDVAPSKHKSCEGHAFTITRPREPELAWICTKPKLHPKKKESWEVTQERKSKKRAEHEKEIAEGKVARVVLAKDLLGKRLTQREVLEQLVPTVLDPHFDQFDSEEVAAELLGIEGKSFKRLNITTLAGKNEKELLRVGLALALAKGEAALAERYRSPSDERVTRYLTFLKKKGYKLTAAEKLELAGKAPR